MSFAHIEDLAVGTIALLLGCVLAGFVAREVEVQVSRGKTLAREALVLVGYGLWSLSFVCVGVLFLFNLSAKDGAATPAASVEGLAQILLAVMILTLAGGFFVLMAGIIRGGIAKQRRAQRDE